MNTAVQHPHPCLGIYEKALPGGLSWHDLLVAARVAGYDYLEMSIDESDERLARIAWSAAQRAEFRRAVEETGIPVKSICLSAHRRFPFGSADPAIRQKAREIMAGAIELAADTGIRTIQLAGYDVYYESSTPESLARFDEGLAWATEWASQAQVVLAMEIMDTPLMGSISKWLVYAAKIRSPWFQVYPDLGNLSAWGNHVPTELACAVDRIAAVHVKDTYAVTPDFPGQFRNVPFGSGCVDFVAAFRALAAVGYRGCFLVEMWADKSPDPIGDAIRAREWVIGKMIEGGLW
ncbi:L-ribulose-5-phosphate 3-epimerase [Uliginosibacterium gangwonense]|uniref:L-ribulose-5-phosphate 3-epimerase n=1 Tax=Uliginosibacterium gangwonense TaxID=392736 RepID=UPI000368BD66|nr:L-ribulose-5-phosphate 3-epimerase [Uliginosibacterium gangwonense]